eukprot:2410469-Rhodomonas_salina.1
MLFCFWFVSRRGSLCGACAVCDAEVRGEEEGGAEDAEGEEGEGVAGPKGVRRECAARVVVGSAALRVGLRAVRGTRCEVGCLVWSVECGDQYAVRRIPSAQQYAARRIGDVLCAAVRGAEPESSFPPGHARMVTLLLQLRADPGQTTLSLSLHAR